MIKMNNDYCNIDVIYVTHLYFESEEKAKRFVEFEKKYNIQCSKILSSRGKKYVFRGDNRYNFKECPYEVTYKGDASDVFEKFEHEEWNTIK